MPKDKAFDDLIHQPLEDEAKTDAALTALAETPANARAKARKVA